MPRNKTPPFPRITQSPAPRGFFFPTAASGVESSRMTQATGIERLRERAPQTAAAIAHAPESLAGSLAAVLEASEFVLDALARDPGLAQALIERAEERLAGPPLPWPLPWSEQP